VIDVDVSVHIEDGKVITESGGAHSRVLQDPDHCVLFMSLLFWSIEARCIPFSNSHLQQVICSNVLQLMGSSEDFPSGLVVVVCRVISDDGTGSNKVIVLVQEDASPWELSWGRLTMGETRDWARVVSGSTLLGAIDWSLLASLGPVCVLLCIELLGGSSSSIRSEALSISLEDREIKIRSIAASLVANWACVEDIEVRGLSWGAVDNSGG